MLQAVRDQVVQRRNATCSGDSRTTGPKSTPQWMNIGITLSKSHILLAVYGGLPPSLSLSLSVASLSLSLSLSLARSYKRNVTIRSGLRRRTERSIARLQRFNPEARKDQKPVNDTGPGKAGICF